MRSDKTQLDPDQMTMTPPDGCPFKVGDIVTFTNDYGVSFPNRKIVGFALPQNVLLGGDCVYLEKDAYWCPVKIKSLTLEAKKVQRIFKTAQVAEILNTTPREVSILFDSGKIRGYRIPGSQDRRIPQECLVRYLEQNNLPIPDSLRD